MHVKPNDVATIHELNDAALDAVSGGVNEMLRAVLRGVAAATGGPRDDGVLPTLPCDSFDIICRMGF